MATEKIRALVLKEMVSGESNKRIVVLAKGHGKMLLSARGAKKTGSKLLAGTQLFAYCDFVVFEGKGFLSVAQADIIESFYALRSDLTKLSYCTYLLDLVERTILEEMEADGVLELLVRTLYLLSRTDYDVRLACRIFELKYLQMAGFLPDMAFCCSCGEVLSVPIAFSPQCGGLLCSGCSGNMPGIIPLENGTWKAVSYILKADGRELFRFQVSGRVLKELRLITAYYIETHMNERFQTLIFAESLDMG